jgi:large subunit ribosomal protein L10
MSKLVKALIRDDYKRAYAGVDSACVVSVIGMNAVNTNRFRGLLRTREIELHVVKNTLARQAFAGTLLEPLGRGLDGPSAIVTGGTSIIDVAKFLVEQVKAFPGLQLRKGLVEGDPDLVPVEQIAKMKSLAEVRADVVASMLSPGRRVAGCIVGPAGRLAGCIKALAEKLEKGETITRAA